MVGLVQDALLAGSNALLHVAEGRSQAANFVLSVHHDRLAVVAVLDALGGFGQLTGRRARAARAGPDRLLAKTSSCPAPARAKLASRPVSARKSLA